MLDLLLHPVRLRIVHAMFGGRTRTTSDLCLSLADVPKTTVYRHVGLLSEAGVLEVVSEHRVHGAVERTFRLRRERSVIGADAAASMSLEDHRHGFAAATAALLAEFNAYLSRQRADPTADSVSYRQFTLWLDPRELAELIAQVRNAILSKMGAKPTPSRTPYLASTLLLPLADVRGSGPTTVRSSQAAADGVRVRKPRSRGKRR